MSLIYSILVYAVAIFLVIGGVVIQIDNDETDIVWSECLFALTCFLTPSQLQLQPGRVSRDCE